MDEDKPVAHAQSVLSARLKLLENLMSVEELAADMGRSKLSVYRWVKEGLPKARIRGKLYFKPEEVALWLKRTTKT